MDMMGVDECGNWQQLIQFYMASSLGAVYILSRKKHQSSRFEKVIGGELNNLSEHARAIATHFKRISLCFSKKQS